MPKTLLGRCIYMFIGCAACVSLIMNALGAWEYYQNWKEELKSKKEESDDEMAYEDIH